MKNTLAALLTVGLIAAAAPAAAQSYNGAGFVIPDVQTGTSTITVGSPTTITGITFSLNGLTHTFLEDLAADLTHSGTTVRWLARTGGGNDLGGTYLISDLGPTTLGGGVGNPRPSGTYAPVDPLAAFIGTSGAGDWTLTIRDQVFLDQGSLGSWTLNLTTARTAVPEPATWSLMMMGFGAVGFAMRRRSKVRTAVGFA